MREEMTRKVELNEEFVDGTYWKITADEDDFAAMLADYE
jgi:hypothetical protein